MSKCTVHKLLRSYSIAVEVARGAGGFSLGFVLWIRWNFPFQNPTLTFVFWWKPTVGFHLEGVWGGGGSLYRYCTRAPSCRNGHTAFSTNQSVCRGRTSNTNHSVIVVPLQPTSCVPAVSHRTLTMTDPASVTKWGQQAIKPVRPGSGH